MVKDFPRSFEEAVDWNWSKFEPYAQELLTRKISIQNLAEWLADESQFLSIIHELNGRYAVAVDQNNTDQTAKARRDLFRDQVWSKTLHLMNQLEEKLIDSKVFPTGYDIQLKRIQNNLEIFHPDNVNLEIEERSYREQYEQIKGNITNNEITHILQTEPDREKRETAYKNNLAARIGVKDDYDAIWRNLFNLRQQIAKNASMPDYRAYMWKKLNRHDYTYQDVIGFCETIEAVIVPVTVKLHKQHADDLGMDILRPWDISFQNSATSEPKPYRNVDEWLQRSYAVFNNISPEFGDYFYTMRSEGLLDLESRPNKSPWNYAEWLPASNRSFIFINGQEASDDLFMLFHEFGHAVQLIEMSALPYMRQKMLPDEISEVASTTMELLASSHLDVFYTMEQAKTVRHNYFTSMIFQWPFIAMVALFQHWAYTHPEEGVDTSACDQCWLSLCERFLPGIDYSGFEDDLRTQWREVFQVFVFPFYFMEYAFAQLGAVQIWEKHKKDPENTIRNFRNALSYGHTVSVPEFYNIAGAKFAANAETLKKAVETIQKNLIS